MATSLLPSYCTKADLQGIYPRISQYDKKRIITGWSVSGNLAKAYNTGIVTMLYKDGEELGDPQTSTANVSSVGTWMYEADKDKLWYYFYVDGGNPQPYDTLMEAGQDFSDLLDSTIYKASRYFDSLIDAKVSRNQWLNEENRYDIVIERTTAQISAFFLISAHDITNEDAVALKAEFTETIDKINTGAIKLGFQITADSSQGILRELNADPATTLKPLDLMGVYSGSKYDKIRITVVTGGAIGTATMSVWIKSSTTLGINKGTVSQTAEIITGDYQILANGLYVRWGGATSKSAGGTTNMLSAVATGDDVYEVEVWGVGGDVQDSGALTSIDVYHG